MRSTAGTVRAWGSAVSLLVLLAACGAPPDRYIQDSTTDVFFSVPSEWSVFDRPALEPSATESNPYQTTEDPVLFLTGFTADESASPLTVLRLDAAKEPTGFSIVFQLNEQEQDGMSMGLLRNRLFQVDSWEEQDPSSVVVFQLEPLSVNGFRGMQMVFSRKAGTDPLRPYAESWTVNQTAYLDPTGTRAYYFVMGCRSDCYQTNEHVIEGIVESWTVTPA